MKFLAAFFALAMLGAPVKAGDAPASLEGLCADAGSNVEIKNCLYENYLAADDELNLVWKRVIAQIRKADYLDPPVRKAWEKNLRQAQRNWVRFKEIDCNKAVLYEWWGGSGAGGAISMCLIRHTVRRTENLKERYFPDG